MNRRRMYLYAVMTVLTAAMWTVSAQGQRDKVKPNLEEGARIYKQNCINCHGPGGKGDGVAAGQLDPKPADLTASSTQDKKKCRALRDRQVRAARHRHAGLDRPTR